MHGWDVLLRDLPCVFSPTTLYYLHLPCHFNPARRCQGSFTCPFESDNWSSFKAIITSYREVFQVPCGKPVVSASSLDQNIFFQIYFMCSCQCNLSWVYKRKAVYWLIHAHEKERFPFEIDEKTEDLKNGAIKKDRQEAVWNHYALRPSNQNDF